MVQITLYGFVHPESGETYWWILPRFSTELFNRVLADFARALLRRCQQTNSLNCLPVQVGIQVMSSSFQMEFTSSPCLPIPLNYNSSVRLWPLTNEIVANHSPHNLDEVRRIVTHILHPERRSLSALFMRKNDFTVEDIAQLHIRSLSSFFQYSLTTGLGLL